MLQDFDNKKNKSLNRIFAILKIAFQYSKICPQDQLKGNQLNSGPLAKHCNITVLNVSYSRASKKLYWLEIHVI